MKFNVVQCLNCGVAHALDVVCPIVLSRVELPCPRCASLEAQLDELQDQLARVEDTEGMAKVIIESETDKTIEWSDNLGDWLRKNYLRYLRHARAVQKFIKGEG